MGEGRVVHPEGNRGILLTDWRPSKLYRLHSASLPDHFFSFISQLCLHRLPCSVHCSLNLQPFPASSSYTSVSRLPTPMHNLSPSLTALSNSTFPDVCWLQHQCDSQASCSCHLAFESCMYRTPSPPILALITRQ